MLDGMRSGAHSFGIKIAFGLIILVFIFWGIGTNTSNSGVVAKVNGEPVTVNEFQQAVDQMANEIKTVIPDITAEQLQKFGLEQRALQNVVISKLFLAESKRLGIDVSAIELRDALMNIPYFFDEKGKFSAEIYTQRLKAVGQTPANFENTLRSDLLPQKFQEVVTAGIFADKAIAKKMFEFQTEQRAMDYVLFPFDTEAQNVSDDEAKAVYEERKNSYAVPASVSLEFISFDPKLMADEKSVSDAEISAYYEQNKAKYREDEQVKARHILLMLDPNASKEDADKTLKQINDIAAQIKTADDFAKMAEKYGQDGTKNSGGDLGWFGKDQMVKEFADVAFSLPAGRLSEPVRTQFGYHLIWVDEKKNARDIPLEEVKDSIRSAIAAEKVQVNLEKTIDAAIANVMADGNMKAEAEKHRLKAVQTGLVPVNVLTEQYGMRRSDVDALTALADNTVWDTPLSIKTAESGEGVLSVVKVLENKTSSIKSFDEVKEEIVAELKLKKAQESAKAEAQKAVAGFAEKAPENVKRSVYFSRDGQVENLGPLPELAQEIFASDGREWLKNAYISDEGAVVAKLADIKTADAKDFEAIENDILLNMEDAQKNMLFQAYILMLNKEAKIEILMPQLFEQK